MATNDADAAVRKKVLLVDDHPVFRRGLTHLIEEEGDLTVCGEAADVAGALRLLETTQPDIALVDLTLADSSGIELIKDFGVRAPGLSILVVSMHDEGVYAERVLGLGARGYVSKREDPGRVIEAIRQVLAGRVFISEQVSAKIIQKSVGPRQAQKERSVEQLSDREFQVFEMIGDGFSTQEIAEKLHLSSRTVDSHRENIKRKLGLPDAWDLRKYAVSWVRTNRDR